MDIACCGLSERDNRNLHNIIPVHHRNVKKVCANMRPKVSLETSFPDCIRKAFQCLIADCNFLCILLPLIHGQKEVQKLDAVLRIQIMQIQPIKSILSIFNRNDKREKEERTKLLDS